MYREALFVKHRIRECFVRVDRLTESEIRRFAHKKKLLPSKGNLRSEVSWLPNSSSVLANSAQALSTLAVYHETNNIVPPGTRKGVRRQRAKSMFESRAKDDEQSNDINRIESKDDSSELQVKFNSPNFGLKPSHDRSLGSKPEQPQSQWQKMNEEFKKRIELKLAKK